MVRSLLAFDLRFAARITCLEMIPVLAPRSPAKLPSSGNHDKIHMSHPALQRGRSSLLETKSRKGTELA